MRLPHKEIDKKTDWIVYGLGSALCRYQPEVRIDALAQAASITVTEASQAINDKFVTLCNSGEYSLTQMLDAIRERLDADLTYAHLMGLWSLAYEPDVDFIKFAHALHGTDAGMPRAVLLCAGSPLLEDALDAYLPEVDQLVTRTFYSHKFNRAEFNVDVLRAVRTELAVPANSLLYVSDDASARSAAVEDGWGVLAKREYRT